MKKQWLRRRTGWGLVLAPLLVGITGCSHVDWKPQASARPRSATLYRYGKPQATLKTQPIKPAEATDDHRYRHPSMWKRKLKATFT